MSGPAADTFEGVSATELRRRLTEAGDRRLDALSVAEAQQARREQAALVTELQRRGEQLEEPAQGPGTEDEYEVHIRSNRVELMMPMPSSRTVTPEETSRASQSADTRIKRAFGPEVSMSITDHFLHQDGATGWTREYNVSLGGSADGRTLASAARFTEGLAREQASEKAAQQPIAGSRAARPALSPPGIRTTRPDERATWSPGLSAGPGVGL